MADAEHMDASPAHESNQTRKSSSPKQNVLEDARNISKSVCGEPSENGQHEHAEISPVPSNCILTEQSGLPPEDGNETILGMPPPDATEESLTEQMGLPSEDAIKKNVTEQVGLCPEVVTKSSGIEKLGQSEPPAENLAQHSSLDQLGSAPRDLVDKRTTKLVKKRKYKLRSSASSTRVLRSRLQEKSKVPHPSNNSVNSSASRERKRRKKARMYKKTADEFVRIRTHLRYLLNRMSYEQNLIDVYSAEGWKGKSVEKLKPEKELQRASSEISRRKLKIRDLFQHLDSLCADGRLPESLFDSEGQIDSEDIFCAKCGSKDMSVDNDIILCDGACDRGFHQFCLEPPLLKEEIPPDDEGWLCPACDCKVDCMDMLNDSQGTKLSVTDGWENVFPEAVAAGNNQDNSSRFSSDDSEDNDYDPDCPEVDEMVEGDESSSDKSDGSNEFSKSDDMVVSPNNKQCQGHPSSDSEDDDYDPDAPEIDEQVNQGSSSSDFTSDSEDFGATLGSRNFSNKEDGLDGERRFGGKKKETLKDELLSVLESNSGQDNAPVSAKRHVERLDYKRLHDEAYGNVSSDSSDDEDWTENVTLRKRKNLSGIVASMSPNGNTSITENGTNTKDRKHNLEAPGCTPKQRSCQSLKIESTINSQSPGSTGETSRPSSYKRLGEATTERLYKSFQENQYPDRTMKEKLAEELGMTSRKVSKWFENARWSFRHRPPNEASPSKSVKKKDTSSYQTDQKPEQEVLVNESPQNGVGKKESPKAGASKVDCASGAKRGRKSASDGSHFQNSSPKSTRQKTKSSHEASEASDGSSRHNSFTPKSTRQKRESNHEASEAADGTSRQNPSTPKSTRQKRESNHEASEAVDASSRQDSSTPKSNRQKTKSKHEASEATDGGSSGQSPSIPMSTRQKTKPNHEASEATDGSSRQNPATLSSKRLKSKSAGPSTPNSKRRKTKSGHEASDQVSSSKKTAKTAQRTVGRLKATGVRIGRIQTRSRKSVA